MFEFDSIDSLHIVLAIFGVLAISDHAAYCRSI